MKKACGSLLLALLLLFTAGALYARSWDDLHEGSGKLFGSEKEAKYDINMFFIEKEAWEDHHSFMCFWLLKFTDYPKYSSRMFLPFYYKLESKIDARKFSYIFLTYRETDVVETSSYTAKYEVLYSPVFCKTTDFINGTETENKWWFPIIPLVYRSTDSYDSHTNIAWLIDLAWNKEKNGEEYMKRLFVMPFIWYGKNESSSFFSVAPLFMKKTEYYESHKTSFLMSPLFYRASNYTNGVETENRFWTPIIPLLYYNSKDEEGSHSNFLLVFDWGKDASGRMERFFFLPLVFHSFAEDGYVIYLPFYYRPAGNTPEEGMVFSPIYYHSWSNESETKWSWFLHYKNSDFVTGKKTNIWFPVYFSNEVPENESLGQEKYYSKIFAPLYWRINTARRDTTLFLPFYFETAKNDGSGSLYINILGYSKSILAGTSPVIGVGAGMNQGSPYIDTDASWLFDMVSVSTRFTIPFKDGESQDEETDTGVNISKVNSASRKDSRIFWGFRLFYGLVAYQKADSRKHFRLLPLSWLTWDEASADEFRWVINYLSYKNEDNEYFVFFPVYGYQRTGESFSKGFLLNAYWYEYDDETKTTEHTILWPFINLYNSPKNDGFRIIPLIRRRNIVQDDSSLYSSTYTPVYINRSVKSADDGSTLYRLNMSLLHFYNCKKETDSHSKLFFFWIPFFLNEENASVEDNVNVTRKLKWLLPLGIIRETEKTSDGQNYSSNFRLWGLPLLYYRKSVRFDSNGDAVSRSSNFFLLGYQRKSEDVSGSSFLFGLYRSESDSLSQNYSYGFFYGLFNVSQKGKRFASYFRPFYYYAYDDEHREKSLLMGLYRRKNNANDDSASDTTSWFYYLFGKSNFSYTERDNDGEAIIADGSETWLIPLFYKTNLVYRDGSETWHTSFSLLHYRNSETTLNGTSKTNFYPIIPLYYHSENNQENHTNIFWLWDTAKNQNSKRKWLIPFYFHKTTFSENGSQGYRHILPPFYFSSWDESEQITSKTILGFKFYDSQREKEENFLHIYRHYRTKNCERCYEEYSLMFSLFKHEKHHDHNSFRILGGLVTDIDWGWRNRDRYDVDAILYLAGFSKYRDNFSSRVIPIWYYSRDKNSSLLVIIPALTWNEKDYYGKFQLWALGALWYRNHKANENEDRQALILGIPYYKVQKPERGYEAWGSLWGLLWQYEKESETGFSKFSLLKFLYQRTVMDGEVRQRILGVRF